MNQDIEFIGEVKRVKKVGHFAQVAVRLGQANDASIIIACCGAGFEAQGYLEDVPADGYDSWKSGATRGAIYARGLTQNTARQIIITRISGLTTHTNPCIVAIASALAVWSALAYEPSTQERQRLDQMLFDTWSHRDDGSCDCISWPATER
jgi:hypothetical protein